MILGWQNPATLANGTNHSSDLSIERPNSRPQVQPSLNTVLNGFGIEPLQNGSREDSQIDGVSLSYGFAPNITPCHIPNVQRKDSFSIGEYSDVEDNSIEKKQIEALCRVIKVPDEDLPIYSFGYSSVRNFSILLVKKKEIVA